MRHDARAGLPYAFMLAAPLLLFVLGVLWYVAVFLLNLAGIPARALFGQYCKERAPDVLND
ncbi:MAG TPA: hypothetical protein VFD85_15475 [Gemmatimonadales bacterium]|nr:hypothetical protein [Gemmatimonadales bacterium]